MDAHASHFAPDAAVNDRDRLVATATLHASGSPEIADALENLHSRARALAARADALAHRRRSIIPTSRIIAGTAPLALGLWSLFLLRHGFTPRTVAAVGVTELIVLVAVSVGLVTRRQKDAIAEGRLRVERTQTLVAEVRLFRAVADVETGQRPLPSMKPDALRRARPRERRAAARRARGARAGSDPGDPEPPAAPAGGPR